jgi:hypothetical protein
MKRDSSNGTKERYDFLLKRPASALVALGMILPEYLLILAVSAILAIMVLATVQAFNHRAEPRHAKLLPDAP